LGGAEGEEWDKYRGYDTCEVYPVLFVASFFRVVFLLSALAEGSTTPLIIAGIIHFFTLWSIFGTGMKRDVCNSTDESIEMYWKRIRQASSQLGVWVKCWHMESRTTTTRTGNTVTTTTHTYPVYKCNRFEDGTLKNVTDATDDLPEMDTSKMLRVLSRKFYQFRTALDRMAYANYLQDKVSQHKNHDRSYSIEPHLVIKGFDSDFISFPNGERPWFMKASFFWLVVVCMPGVDWVYFVKVRSMIPYHRLSVVKEFGM